MAWKAEREKVNPLKDRTDFSAYQSIPVFWIPFERIQTVFIEMSGSQVVVLGVCRVFGRWNIAEGPHIIEKNAHKGIILLSPYS